MMVFFAAVLPVMILFCGFALDLGLLQVKQMQMQSAADAAAVGAELEVERNTGNYAAQGMADAGVNGFTDGTANTTVTIVPNPTSGPYAGYHDVIQATVSQTVNTIFMGALNGGRFTITAQAAALVPPCHSYLNTAGLNAYALWLASAGDYGSCPIYANKAIGVDGFAGLFTMATNVTGSSGGSNISGATGPAPRYDATVMADPLASLALPTFPNRCNYTSMRVTRSSTLRPGVYCKGLTIAGPNSGITVTLNPGLYIFTQGGNWQNVTMNGSGVTLFFTKGNTAAQGNTYGTLSVRSATINLSAPTVSAGGTIPEVLICNDRRWVHTGAQDFSFVYSSIYGDGIWYLTGTGISSFGANSRWSAPNYFAMDVDNAYIYYTTVLPAENFSNIATGNPFRKRSVLVQ